LRKSVIKSMVAGCLAVMIISFLLMTPLFFMSMQKDEIKNTYAEMDNTINHIKPLADMALTYNTRAMYRAFDESMRQYSYFTDSDILFLDQSGMVVWSNRQVDLSIVEKHSSEIFDIFQKSGSIKTVGLMDGIYREKTITVGEYIANESVGKGYVLLYTKILPDVFDKYKTVILDILVMELAAIVFIAGFLWMFSLNITGPLKKINKSLVEFSKGNFDSKVTYESENELGELARNINAMADSLKNLENMRSSFISDVSHELRTPMTSISGFVEGILDGTIPPENRDKYLKIVLSESRRLSRLVNDLLNVSRIDSGKLKVEKTEFDIVELIRLVLIKFEDAITFKNLDVMLETDGEQCWVYADKDAMTQVITNLIHNSVKFSGENGYIKIAVSENTVSDKCEVSVSNDGPGISSEKLKYIWDRFYKADESRSSDKSGVGLGLYIVMRIINAHGEKINVESEPNEYTKFTFTVDLSEYENN